VWCYDDIASKCDEPYVLPSFQTAGWRPRRHPGAAKLGRRQIGAPPRLTAQPSERRRLVEDRMGDISHCLPQACQFLI